MELLRRALLIGCTLPALWLYRLAPLDPVLAIARVDPGAEKRSASDAVPVAGPDWSRFLRGIDALEQGAGAQDRWRVSPDPPEPGAAAPWAFYRSHESPIGTLAGKLAVGAGTALISIARSDGDAWYRVDRRAWTRQEFRPGSGFTGRPTPPSEFLYPFQHLAIAVFLVGAALFILIPSPARAHGSLSPGECGLLAAALLLFAAPLFATGGSVQALTSGLAVTLPCWVLGAVAVHFFAKPGRNAPHPLFAPEGDGPGAGTVAAGNLPTFLRWGVVMLAVAIGPLTSLVAVSIRLWNR